MCPIHNGFANTRDKKPAIPDNTLCVHRSFRACYVHRSFNVCCVHRSFRGDPDHSNPVRFWCAIVGLVAKTTSFAPFGDPPTGPLLGPAGGFPKRANDVAIARNSTIAPRNNVVCSGSGIRVRFRRGPVGGASFSIRNKRFHTTNKVIRSGSGVRCRFVLGF